ncbi:hypothetical protein HF325_001622 [Metschnikowia pulcherrima]|uniref:Uncharacterized protein n=1 Tax=Metschnikowia pulcherrima TaxID=27326 RepID=A0A8H7GX53_9ASCO|nr:hypothetical protein HF325_001622 [Metschnikowia pulcherrima]
MLPCLTRYSTNDNDWSYGHHDMHNKLIGESEDWVKNILEYQIRVRKVHEACIWQFKLEHSTYRFDTRTLWIHIKAQPLSCALAKDKRIPEILRRLTMFDEYCLEGGAERTNRAMRHQTEQ